MLIRSPIVLKVFKYKLVYLSLRFSSFCTWARLALNSLSPSYRLKSVWVKWTIYLGSTGKLELMFGKTLTAATSAFSPLK